jgi:hypothetical protein
VPPTDPLLAEVLKEVRETRADLLEADTLIRESLTSLNEKVAIQNGRVTRLEIDVAEGRAAQRERFALKHELVVVGAAFVSGSVATVVGIIVALH